MLQLSMLGHLSSPNIIILQFLPPAMPILSLAYLHISTKVSQLAYPPIESRSLQNSCLTSSSFCSSSPHSFIRILSLESITNIYATLKWNTTPLLCSRPYRSSSSNVSWWLAALRGPKPRTWSCRLSSSSRWSLKWAWSVASLRSRGTWGWWSCPHCRGQGHTCARIWAATSSWRRRWRGRRSMS